MEYNNDTITYWECPVCLRQIDSWEFDVHLFRHLAEEAPTTALNDHGANGNGTMLAAAIDLLGVGAVNGFGGVEIGDPGLEEFLTKQEAELMEFDVWLSCEQLRRYRIYWERHYRKYRAEEEGGDD